MALPEKAPAAAATSRDDVPPHSLMQGLWHKPPLPLMWPSTPVPSDGLQVLRLQLAAIPTKQYMEGYIRRLEFTYKSEIQALTTNLSDQVQRLEGRVASISTHQAVQDQVVDQHT